MPGPENTEQEKLRFVAALPVGASDEGCEILARILGCCPRSQLMVLAGAEGNLSVLETYMERQGVDVGRLCRQGQFPLSVPGAAENLVYLHPWNGAEHVLRKAMSEGAAVVVLEAGGPAAAFAQGLGLPLMPGAEAFVEWGVRLGWSAQARLELAERVRTLMGLPSALPPVWVNMARHGGGLRRMCTRGLDLDGQLGIYYGRHRGGWTFATNILEPLNNPYAPYFESFVERRFNWGDWLGEKRGPILKAWFGIIHVPLSFPTWFSQANGFLAIREGTRWKQSLPYCKGLFTLSQWHKEQFAEIQRQYAEVDPELARLPVEVLRHPAEAVDLQWSPEAFLENPQPSLVQAGITYRNLHAVQNIPTHLHKIILQGGHVPTFVDLYEQEHAWLLEQGTETAPLTADIELRSFLEDGDYDELLSKNIIVCQYYTASASNTVVECMARNTPLLINPLPPVVEYLGPDYPLYFTTYAEAAEKVGQPDLVLQTHRYLKNMNKEFLSPQYFVNSILESKIYSL